MKKMLPDIHYRSMTPSKLSIKDFKAPQIKSNSQLHKGRQVSLSPLRISPNRYDSNESIFNIRTVSDEIQTSKTYPGLFLKRIKTMLTDLDAKNTRRNLQKKITKGKRKRFEDIATALLHLTNSTNNKVSALNCSQLFISLGYVTEHEALSNMFSIMCKGDALSKILLKKGEILRVCEDPRVDGILSALLREYKLSGNREKAEEFDSLVDIIKKWWSKLDIGHKGLVNIEDVCRFFITIEAIETSYDAKKLFGKMSEYIIFRQFFGFFAKALFKFLLLSLHDLANQKQSQDLPPDIAIGAQRRKMIIEGLSGENRVIETLIHYTKQ